MGNGKNGMNKRIKELAKQASGTKKYVPPVWQFYDDELEYFAELIVRKCAQIAYNSPQGTADGAILAHFDICDHEWVSAKNAVVQNGSICAKCHRISSHEPEELNR